MKKYFCLFLLLLTGCASNPKLSEALKRDNYTSPTCQRTYEKALESNSSDKQLDLISLLFADSCFHETIQLGSFVRQKSHDKIYGISAEMAEVVTPEGTFTDYVMESYERTYLSLLMSISYLGLKDNENAQIELRRSQQEALAVTYNYGDDNVLRLLQAALWDRFDPMMARPYWQSLRDNSGRDLSVRRFVDARLAAIDQHPSEKAFWHITGFGYFAKMKGRFNFFSAKSVEIWTEEPFPKSCSNQSGILMSTKPWADKLTTRYDSSYHPLLLGKSFARVPAGISYGVLGFSVGVAVGAGTCMLGAELGPVGGGVCDLGAAAALLIFTKTAQTVSKNFQPDLRHWESIPRSFYVTTQDKNDEVLGCFAEPDIESAIKFRLL